MAFSKILVLSEVGETSASFVLKKGMTELRKPLHQEIEELLAPLARDEGYELVAVESAGAPKSPVIRVFLDIEGGITIDQIVQANHWISKAIEDKTLIGGSYTLEVSSPGIDRPLSKSSDFMRYVGEFARIKTKPINGRGTFTGRIVKVSEGRVTLDLGVDSVEIDIASITKARLKGRVNFGQKGEAENEF